MKKDVVFVDLFHLSDVIDAKIVMRNSLKREMMRNLLKLKISTKPGVLLNARYDI